MIEQTNVLYTAEATATGGREGHASTSDGRLDVDRAAASVSSQPSTSTLRG